MALVQDLEDPEALPESPLGILQKYQGPMSAWIVRGEPEQQQQITGGRVDPGSLQMSETSPEQEVGLLTGVE